MKVTRTRDGLAYLHLWREGDEYFRQKGDKLKEWTNIMFAVVPQPPMENVFYVDLSRRALDFPDATFDAINAYHLLEHLSPEEGARLSGEIFRVLKPGAVFRASVPDLEGVCREYLYQLEAASREPTVQRLRRYRWNVMQLLDQFAREKSGGMMLDAFRAGDFDEQYIDEKYSDVYRPYFKYREEAKPVASGPVKKTLWQRVKTLTPWTFSAGVKWRVADRVRRFTETRRATRYHPYASRENWRWAYDRLSLGLLLENAGFIEVESRDFKTSGIPHWDRYDLDRSNFADRAIDPSVYVEGRKPSLGRASEER